jgi:signal transduction histidine kinase
MSWIARAIGRLAGLTTSAPGTTPFRRPLSIRLRLTLLFTAVLAGTLLLFGIALHALLARTLMAAGDRMTATQARLVSHEAVQVQPDGTLAVRLRPSKVFGRYILTQVVDVRTDQVVARSSNLGRESLPVTTVTMSAARKSESWVETVRVEDLRLRVFSVPVIADGRPVAVVQVARSLAADDMLLGQLLWLLVTLAALGLPAAAVLGWVVAGRALAPIRVIADTAGEIGRARDFSRRVEHRGPADELGHLAGAINVMLDDLEQAHGGLVKSARQTEQALAAQRRFVASASHELRTPLTTIRLNAEVLAAMEAEKGSERAKMLADIAGEADRLGRLVSNLLMLARADAGWRPNLARTALRPIVEEAFRQAQVLADGRHLELNAPRDAVITGDSDLLKQLILILLDNAVKYTPADGRITLGLTTKDGVAELSASDTGPGIAPEDIPRIFDRFYRADRARQTDGSGLGLSMARWIAEQHGAHIGVVSDVGRGTTFTVRFPRAREA